MPPRNQTHQGSQNDVPKEDGVIMSLADLVISYPSSECEELSTESEHGLDRHTLYKNQSQILASVLRYLHLFNQANRTEGCNSIKVFQACAANIGHPKKLIQASYCKDRFCATCQWLRSRKAFRESMAVGEHILVHDPTLRFIFLTLTVPNLPLEHLGDGITAMMKGWQRLIQRKRVKDITLGYHRSLEVSYNPRRNDYHPHFHALFVVPNSYFNGRNYINQSEWLSLWRSCMRDESINQVDVRAVKPKALTQYEEAEFLDTLQDVSPTEREQSLKMIKMAGAFAECCKYGVKEWSLSKIDKHGKRKGAILSVKEERIVRHAMMNCELDFGLPGHIWIRDTLKESARTFKPLRKALRNRRLIQPGGIVAKARKELRLKDKEDDIGDELKPEEKQVCSKCGCDLVTRMAYWENFYDRYTGEKSHMGKYLIPTNSSFEIPY